MAFRRAIGAALALAWLAAPAMAAKDWPKRLFTETKHDFGVVARGANVQHRFVIENPYVEDVEIASVTSTCGCTIPVLTKKTLKTYESTDLVAQLDTRRFYGHKQATLKIVFNKPTPAEFQLHVSCYIRSDVVFEPGSVHLGTVPQGKRASQRVIVTYAGRRDWQILDVVSAASDLTAQLREISRIGQTPNAKVEYELLVSLKEDAPPGTFKEQIALKTNDPNQQTALVPLDVEGLVVPSLSVSPSSLMLGVMRPQQVVVRNVGVFGDKPFRITRVIGPDARFQFTTPTEAKARHLVPVTFTATGAAGRVTGKIRVETDLPGVAAVEVNVDGQVVAAGTSASKADGDSSPATPTLPPAKPENPPLPELAPPVLKPAGNASRP